MLIYKASNPLTHFRLSTEEAGGEISQMEVNRYTNYDTPEPWGLFFQDNATPQMEGLEELHNNIMFYLCIILFAVT